MTCCTPTGYRTIFGARTVEREARRYARKGLVPSAGWLRDRLAAGGLEGKSVLEIGGGIGDLGIELVQAGAAHATNIELIDTYEQTAEALAAERGLRGRVDRRIGDFAVAADEAPAADIVVMHRVVCCYPDPEALVAAGCDHGRDRVAVTIPRETWWVKLGFATMNAWFRLRRIGFQAYVHPIERMVAVAAAHGFRRVDEQRGRVWTSIVLARQRGTPVP